MKRPWRLVVHRLRESDQKTHRLHFVELSALFAMVFNPYISRKILKHFSLPSK